jgi:hypothetical protein
MDAEAIALLLETERLMRDGRQLREMTYRSLAANGVLIEKTKTRIKRSRALLDQPLLYPFANRRPS